ncbi:hypothetical protein [Nocardia sp. NPDC057353]|uniref:hypothetical protein n=1 Tax=Nocardia sp. NPDC057353 TaxID=3346104 RepID=UPI00363E74C8
MSTDLEVELRRLEKAGSTGVLRASDGEFHLAEGAIVSAECRWTTGLDRLVVEAGVATEEDWRRAGAGDPTPVLGRPRLETLALLSVFDAAYFLLATAERSEFHPAPAHWLAPVCHVPPQALMRECARRGDPRSGPWPAGLVDRAAVVPVRRVRRRRVVLTGGQTEVLAIADGHRTIASIARSLGRTAYGVLEAVRELTAAELIEHPVVLPEPLVTETPTLPVAALTMTPAPLPAPPALPVTALPRRVAQPVEPLAPYDRLEPVDAEVLVRLKAALEELQW